MSNTLWALILPLCVSSFNVTISRTFFRTTIPDSIIESAKIDGATQMTVFAKIVLPISKPVLATIGLFLAFGYWNDWFQSSLFITDNNLLSLQALLNSMQKNIEYIAQHPDPASAWPTTAGPCPPKAFVWQSLLWLPSPLPASTPSSRSTSFLA